MPDGQSIAETPVGRTYGRWLLTQCPWCLRHEMMRRRSLVCTKDWHFLGWFDAKTALRMVKEAKAVELRLRVGEQTLRYRGPDDVEHEMCDVWIDPNPPLAAIAVFWAVMEPGPFFS